MSEIALRRARPEDLPRLHVVREAAFAPVFASFRALLGDELYALTQAPGDGAQGALLESMLAADSKWEVWVATIGDEVVGFVGILPNPDTRVGELGLNAVHPEHGGKGIGTAMYEHALARMRELGMRAATVGTGLDASHAPARRAYAKAGFERGIPTVWLSRML